MSAEVRIGSVLDLAPVLAAEGKVLVGRCRECRYYWPLPEHMGGPVLCYCSRCAIGDVLNANDSFSLTGGIEEDDGLLLVGPDFGCVHWEAKE